MADVKARFQTEGENSFSNAFKNATSSVKALDSALKLNSAAYETVGDKMQGLKEKSQILKDEIAAQEKVVKLAAEELKRLTAEYGEGSTKANQYQEKVNNAQTKLEQLRNTLAETEKNMKNLGDMSQAAGDKLEAVGGKMSAIGDKLKYISAGATAGLTYMFNAASDLNENINKTDVVFDEFSQTIQDWSKTTLESYGIAQSSALEMAAAFGDMATSMGLTTEQAAEMGKELVGRAGDMASFKNISLETAQTGLEAIFTGQAQSLKKFGVVMTQSTLEAYALANGYTKQYDEMTQAEQVMLRYAYVMDQTKNSAGDFANTQDGAANSVRIARESFKEAAATLGQEVIPLVLPLIQGATEVIQSINSMDESTKNLIVSGVAVAAVAGPILSIGGKLISGIGFIAKTLLPALASAFGTAGTAATVAGATGGAAISSMLGPIALVMAGVAALTAAIVGAIKLLDSFEDKKNRAQLDQRMSEINKNYKKINSEDADFYNPSDRVGVWNGSGWDEYVKRDAKMTPQGRRDYMDRQMERDSIENNYNFDVNVQNISDLQDLLDMSNSAQMLDRMGVYN